MLDINHLSERPAQASTMTTHHMLALFSQNVRRLRQQAGISQEDLAKRCTKYKTQIGPIEDGTAKVNLSMVYVLARALEVDPSTLLQEPTSTHSKSH